MPVAQPRPSPAPPMQPVVEVLCDPVDPPFPPGPPAHAVRAAVRSRGRAGERQTEAPKGPDDNAVFFASDGMRQDLVAKYAGQGVMPTMKEFLKKGTSAANGGLLTQAPPNTGAGWYSLATGAWPAVHGSTNNTFFTVGQAFTTARRRPSTRASCRSRRSPSPPSAAASRSPRSSGPVARTRRSRARRSTSSRSSPAAAWRPTSSARPVTRCSTTGRSSTASACSSTIPPAIAGNRRLCRRRRSCRRPTGQGVPRIVQPGQGDAPPRPRRGSRQVRPQRLHLRQHQRRHDQLRQGPLLEDQERRGQRRRPCARASGPT